MTRNSYQCLCSDTSTIAKYSFRCAIIGYILAKIKKTDENKIMKMCLFYNISETRTGDLNLINKKYLELFE